MAIQNHQLRYHGVQSRSDHYTWQEPSFQQAFETLARQPEQHRLQISSYIWNPKTRPVLFVLRGNPRWQVFLNETKLFNKQLVIPGGRSTELRKGFSRILLKYQEGAPPKLPEIRWSTDFVYSHVISDQDSYLAPVATSQIKLEKIGIAAGILARFNMILLPVYLLLRRPASRLYGTLQKHPYSWLLFGLFLGMAVVRFAGFRYQMEEALHPDERLVRSMILEVEATSLELKKFWYTTGFIYASTAVDILTSWVLGAAAPPHFAQRLVSALSSVASCILVLWLGSALVSKKVGTLAALLFGFSFMPVYLAHFGIIEPFLVFLFLAALLLIVRLEKNHDRISFAVAGVLSGFVIATKQTGLFVAIPFAVIFLILLKRKVLKNLGLLELSTFFGSAFAGYFLLAPYTILRFSEFYDYQVKQLMKLHGETSVRFFRSGMEMGKSSFAILLQNLEDGLGYPFLIVAVIGMLWMCWKSRFAALILVPLSVLYFVVSGNAAVVPYHYALLLCPFLALFAAYSLTSAVSYRGQYSAWIIAMLAALILIIPLNRVFTLERLLQGIDTRRQAEEWCYKNLPAGSRIDYELFGPRLFIPMFDSTTVPVFKRPRWKRYYMIRSPQYYIEDSLSWDLFASPDPKSFPIEREWLLTIRQSGVLIKEFKGERRWLFNPDVRIYRIPQLSEVQGQEPS